MRGPQLRQPPERLVRLVHADELPLRQAERVALAQRQDQFQLPGVQHVGDLAQVGQGVHGGAEHDRRQRDRQPGLQERPHSGHGLVVVAADPGKGRPRPVKADVDKRHLPGQPGCHDQAAGGVGRQPDDEAGVHVHDLGQVAAQQRLPAGQEHPLHPGQAGADGVKLVQRRVGHLQRLRAEPAVEVAALGDLQDH